MNRDAYNKIAASWDRARQTFYGRERDYLDALLSGLPPRSRILDLGCGTGRPMAEYIVSCGHEVIAVDQAAQLLALAAARMPQVRWVESRIENFRTEESFAAILCWDTLFHIERSRHRALLSGMVDMLSDGGRLMISVGGSDHPAFTDTMFGETFFYDSHPPDTVLALLGELGFETVIAEFMNLPTSGRDKGRFAVVAQLAARQQPSCGAGS